MSTGRGGGGGQSNEGHVMYAGIVAEAVGEGDKTLCLVLVRVAAFRVVWSAEAQSSRQCGWRGEHGLAVERI